MAAMVCTRRTSEVSHWHLMPVDILTTVFTLLPEKDRCQAGLVCKAWNAVVNTPHLWRHHTFSFRGTNETEAWRACRFVDSYLGTHVLHMVLEIGMPVVLNAKTISRSVETFLSDRATLSLRLKSFQCSGLEYFQSPVYRIARHRSRMVRALCTFLRRQKWLEEIDLACCQMGRPDGTRVLKAIAYKGRRSLKNPQSPLTYLELRHFFMQEANILDCPLFPVEMRRFDSLRHLCLNHSYVNDDVLDSLTNPSNTLRVLQLQVEASQYIHLIPLSSPVTSKSVLTAAGWRSAAGRCPLLRVFINMKGRFRTNDFMRVLVPGIPLAELRVSSVVASLFFGLEDFLPHIRVLMDLMNQHYSDYLTTFHINWSEMGAIWPYEADLVRLFQQCRFLSDFILTMRVPLDTLLNIHKAVVAEKRGRLKLQIAGVEPPLMENFCHHFPYITVKHLGD